MMGMVVPTCFLHLYLCSASLRHGPYILLWSLSYPPSPNDGNQI